MITQGNIPSMRHTKKPANRVQATGVVRIISGQWRGRKLPVLAGDGLRPTTDRTKETVFNWLMNDINGMVCVDAFAGSGSLGFEALSRGAKQVTFFEKNKIYGEDPFKTDGYSNMMCDSLRYAEDIDVIKKRQIKSKKRQMVLYKEPQPINELYTGSYSLLGINKMSDFSCSNGTDYIKAYTDPEEQIDTVRRYKNVDHLLNDRSSQTFHKTDEEIEYSKQLERQRRRLEQQRISNMTRNERFVSEKYINLNRRLK